MFPGHYDQKQCFHVHERNKALILRNNGTLVKFKNLPPECQLALIHYMAIDGEAWDGPEKMYDAFRKAHAHTFGSDEYNKAMDKACKKVKDSLPHFVKNYGEVVFGYIERLDLKELIAQVMTDDDLTEQTWEEYHKWYMSKGTKHQARSNLYPVILSSWNGETLEDGWNRFHHYAERNLSYFPAIWFPAKEVMIPTEITVPTGSVEETKVSKKRTKAHGNSHDDQQPESAQRRNDH
jgi:hypothetical protein